ncbi:MAG TPA: lipid-binding SYLF domain-containing protein [Terriglobales bacterium]
MTHRSGAISRVLIVILSTAALLLLSTVGLAAQTDNSADQNNQSDIEKRIKAAAQVLDEVMSEKDKAIPDKIMQNAKCVAVVPSMVKIALGFGGNHGKGVATCRTANGWSAPAPFSITGGSWGLQIGGQAIDLVMLVMNQKGMDSLLSSKFKVGADASAAAGPVGRQGEASTDWKMKAEVLTYSRARGVFAGVDLSGAKIAQDRDETRILYGKMVPFATILNGKVNPPAGSEPFLAAVRKYSSQAREQGSLDNSGTTTTAASETR